MFISFTLFNQGVIIHYITHMWTSTEQKLSLKSCSHSLCIKCWKFCNKLEIVHLVYLQKRWLFSYVGVVGIHKKKEKKFILFIKIHSLNRCWLKSYMKHMCNEFSFNWWWSERRWVVLCFYFLHGKKG